MGTVALLLLVFSEGETLYNGIVLPDAWPPAREISRELMAPPYLASPPNPVVIDVGRQLFVDDFLIEQTDLRRTCHAATYYEHNPVLTADRAWEKEGESQGHPAPTAMPFSDGVWYDARDRLFKMWYMAGYCKRTAYAKSTDGIHWVKPELPGKGGANTVQDLKRDSTTVWLDLFEPDPARRYKMFSYHGNRELTVYFSADGLAWGEPAAVNGPTGDRTTVFYNPFRKVWVYGLRDYVKDCGRIRRYWENKDVLAGMHWAEGQPPFWVGADTLDAQRADLKTPCELYNLDAVAYESLLIGLFSIWRGQPSDRAKPNELCVGFSRDGFHWTRPTHEPFIPVSERYGDWNWANIQSAGGCCLVVNDRLYFYVSGRSGIAGSPASGTSATGLATLRRDGFVSMDAGAQEATLTTRPLQFSGKHLFVNADASAGEVRIEVLDANGNPAPGYAAADCTPITADAVLNPVKWKSAADLAPFAGKPVRFRFHVRQASLYAFWVSLDENGASHGYMAAGGPGFTGPTDAVGTGKGI